MNHRNLKIALASAALAVSGAAMADSPQWTYVQGQVGWGDSPDDGENSQYGGAFSLALFDAMQFGAQYTTGKFDGGGIDDADVDNWNVNIGLHTAVADNADIYADLIYGNIDPDSSIADDDDYYGGRFGFRYLPNDKLEIFGGVQAVKGDDSEATSVNGWGGGRLFITDAFSTGVTFTPDDIRHLEEDSLTIDIRFAFDDQSWLGNN